MVRPESLPRCSPARRHAVLSHELGTPLTPALAASEAMEQSGAVPASLSPDLKMIKRNIELEARLIDDLLDLTRLSHGKLRLSPLPADVPRASRSTHFSTPGAARPSVAR